LFDFSDAIDRGDNVVLKPPEAVMESGPGRKPR